LTGHRVVEVLHRLARINRKPGWITVDNGTEFISKVLVQWAHWHQVQLDFIRPRKPTENAYIESFNGRFRQQCLNGHWFQSLEEARQVVEA
jgi:putative transposase